MKIMALFPGYLKGVLIGNLNNNQNYDHIYMGGFTGSCPWPLPHEMFEISG
jgi:hypothetical protein